MRLDRAVGVEKQHPHRPTVHAPVVVADCPHGQVAHAVAVEIAQRGHRRAEPIRIIQHAGEAALCVADLLVRLDGPVAIEKQYPHGTAAEAPVVIQCCPHGQVAHAVAIEITQ